MRKVFLVMAIATLFATVVFAQERYMIVVPDTLNVRNGPSPDNALVGQLSKGTRVQVLDSSGTWWKIKSGSIEGYVNSSYLAAASGSGSSAPAKQKEAQRNAPRDSFEILSFPPPVEGGDLMIDAGVGLRPFGYIGAKWKIPPLFAQVEYALPVGVPISVGGIFSFYQYGYDWVGYSWKWTDFVIAARGNWHWGFNIEWLDLYSGLSLGYTIDNFESSSGYKWDTSYSGFYFGFQTGAHFYFSKTFGAVVETGYPYWLKAGLALKF